MSRKPQTKTGQAMADRLRRGWEGDIDGDIHAIEDEARDQAHRWVMRIVELDTGKVVREVGPTSEQTADRMVMGALHNLNREQYAAIAVDLDAESLEVPPHA